MRRKDREITDQETILKIIDSCQILRLGLADGEYPYIVPVNFAYTYEDGLLCFYIHGAVAGRKFTLMQKNRRCSFEMDVPIQLVYIPEEKNATMHYQSVMGTADIMFLEGEEKLDALDRLIMGRYEETRGAAYAPEAVKRVAVAKLTVREITAKANLPREATD